MPVNLLIKVVLIKVVYRGEMARGNMNKYKLLWVECVRHNEIRWKWYSNENREHEVPKAKDNAVGRETRFKKKNGLKNNTHKGINLLKG